MYAMMLQIGGSTTMVLVRVLSAWFDCKISDDFLDAVFQWVAVDSLTVINNLTLFISIKMKGP